MRDADPHRRGLVRRFLRECVRPYLGLQLEIGVCLTIQVALELADPLILRAIVDRALGDGDHSLLVLLVAGLAFLLCFRIAFRLLATWLYSYSGLRILFDLRRRAFEHTERLSPYFFRGERAGDTLARLTSDVDVLQRAAAHSVVNAVHDVLTLAGIAAVLVWLDPTLAAALVLLYPLIALLLLWTNRRLRAQGLRARTAVAGLYAFLEEQIKSVRLVQEFRRERAMARRHVEVSRPWIDSNLRLSVLGMGQVSLADLGLTAGIIVVFLVGGACTLSGETSLGTLVAFYTFAMRIHRPLSGLIDVNVDLQVARAALARVFDLLDTKPAVTEPDDPFEPERPVRAASPVGAARTGARVTAHGVGLCFPGGTRVLTGLDFDVAPGEVVALVGPSGSGKSTLAALVARYVDPTEGTVSIDGVPVSRWSLRSLHRTVGLVTQETQLFHDSLAANLRFARPDATDAELRETLEAVELGAFLDELPDGLATPVGEQGLRLSGGERQRLALARALLKDPAVYVLDEATSALDPQTERRVLGTFFERVRGRTVIVIAHHLGSVTEAGRILVLERGRLAEVGTHDELYGARGLYRTLFDDQTARARRRAGGTALGLARPGE